MAADTVYSLRLARWLDAEIELAIARNDSVLQLKIITKKQARLAKLLPVGHPILAITALELAELRWQAGDL